MRARVILCIGLCIALNGIGNAQDAAGSPRTNIEELQNIVRASMEEIILDGHLASGVSLRVRTSRDENSWFVDQAAFNALTSHGMRVTVSDVRDSATVDATLEFNPVTLGVRYTPIFRKGLFGSAYTGRIVEGKFSANLIGADGSVRLSKIYTEAVSDTIAVDAIPSLEHPTLRATRGDPPEQGILDMLLEPVVIIGAAAIAVYLLFTVRS